MQEAPFLWVGDDLLDEEHGLGVYKDDKAHEAIKDWDHS